MKTNYLKRIIALSFTAALFFSSCLKDARQFLPDSVQSNVAVFPLGGLNPTNYGADAITAQGIDTIIFAVGVTAATPPKTATSITIGVDNTIVTSYDAANAAITYQPLPTSAYKLAATTVTVPAGANYVRTSVIVDRTNLDPTISYMLPIKIVSASGLPISANYSVHYYHIIGNDFAGAYLHDFTRVPAAGNFTNRPVTLLPNSPTELEVIGGYYTGLLKYVIDFTKTGNGATATYSNFTIAIDPADVAILTGAGIAITTAPSIVGYDSSTSYTFAGVQQLFANGFTYGVTGPSGKRTNLDQYHH